MKSADNEAKDSDGSAKVALIGIGRSVGAWRLMQMCLPERARLDHTDDSGTGEATAKDGTEISEGPGLRQTRI